jgi:hypothetical protein
VINFDRDAPAACVSGEGILAFPRLMTRVLISSLAISFLLQKFENNIIIQTITSFYRYF